MAVSVPQLFDDHAFDKEALRRYLVRAEELGFAGAWVTEQVVGTAPNLDPSVMLALAAAYTDRIRLGCAVYVSTLSSPLHLAKTIATLDQVSGGRLEVGLGTGGGFRAFGAFGIERDGFVARYLEGLRFMQAAWAQDRVDMEGRFWQASGVAMEPKPFQKPYPPIWFGGGHPDAGRPRRPTSYARPRWSVRSSSAPAATRRASGSPSGCTSRWTTIPTPRRSG